MAIEIISSDSSGGAYADDANVSDALTDGAPHGRAISTSGSPESVYENRGVLAAERSRSRRLQRGDQARLGEEPHPMLPGLDRC